MRQVPRGYVSKAEVKGECSASDKDVHDNNIEIGRMRMSRRRAVDLAGVVLTCGLYHFTQSRLSRDPILVKQVTSRSIQQHHSKEGEVDERVREERDAVGL